MSQGGPILVMSPLRLEEKENVAHSLDERPPRQLPRSETERLGLWLSTLPWNGFATLTFEDERHSDRQCLGCFKSWRRTLWRDHRLACEAAVVVEGSANTRLHLHALVCLHQPRQADRPCFPSPPDVQRTQAWDAWFSHYGRARVSPVGKGSAYYVSKYCLKSDDVRSWFLTRAGWPDNV